MFAPFTPKALLIGIVVLLAAPLYCRAQAWAPYFGNTHFGFGLGSQDSARQPSAVKLADLDGDGDLDAVIAQGGANAGSGESSGFTVLINSFNGFYGLPRHYATYERLPGCGGSRLYCRWRARRSGSQYRAIQRRQHGYRLQGHWRWLVSARLDVPGRRRAFGNVGSRHERRRAGGPYRI